MKLDSLTYRCLWHLKNLFRTNPRPYPIIWKKDATHDLHPPIDLWPQLDEQETENLKAFQREVNILAKISNFVPHELTEKHWLEIAQASTIKQRFEVIRFAQQTEKRRSKEERQKEERAAKYAELKAFPALTEEFNLFRFMTYEGLKNYERAQETMRMIQAFNFKDRPTIAVDCRFLPDHTKRGRNLTFAQLRYLLSTNKLRVEPWPIVFVNVDQEDETVRTGIENNVSMFSTENSYVGEITNRSYTDLFDRDRLIYLSPHTDEVLTTEDVMDERNVFIIGGIVDRIKEPDIHPQASMICAQVDGIRCRQLPLDDYMTWKAGKRFLTLTSVIQILQHVYDSQGNWSEALSKHIPVRNKITMAEKNPNIKQISDHKRVYIQELLRIVRENTQK